MYSALNHPHNKEVFHDVQKEPFEFQFVPIASGSVTEYQKKSLAPPSDAFIHY